MTTRNKVTIALLAFIATGVTSFLAMYPWISDFEKSLKHFAYCDNFQALGFERHYNNIINARSTNDNLQSLNSLSKRNDIRLENMAYIAGLIPIALKDNWINTTTDTTIYHTEMFALVLSRYISDKNNIATSKNIEVILEDYAKRDGMLLYVYLLHGKAAASYKQLLTKYIDMYKPSKEQLYLIFLNRQNEIDSLGLKDQFKEFVE